MSTVDLSKAVAVLSGSSVKPFVRGLCCMLFSFDKCVTKYFFSHTVNVRKRVKAKFYHLGYNKAVSVLVYLNE